MGLCESTGDGSQRDRGFGERVYKSLVLVFFSWELKIELFKIRLAA